MVPQHARNATMPDKASSCRGLEVTEVETEELTENNFRGSASDLQDHDGIFRWEPVLAVSQLPSKFSTLV